MVDGGRQICDRAIDMWWNGKYGSDEKINRENMNRWKAIRELISDLGEELKEQQ